MKGLILEVRGPFAIVLLPGGELRRVLRRRGWKTGMIVDPDAVHSGGFARAGLAMAMVLALMLGLGAYRAFIPRSDVPTAASPNGRMPLTLPTPEASPTATSALSPTPSPVPTPSPTASPTTAASGRHHGDDHDDHDDHDDDDDDFCTLCGETGHEADDNCSICGAHGHEDDDHCDYCGQFGHDDDDCPYAPPGWDDDD